MHTLTADNHGIEIAYQRFESTYDPLLLIMGIGADMLYWHDEFCAALVNRGFDVVRFDNRDAGESTNLDWAGTPGPTHRGQARWSTAANEMAAQFTGAFTPSTVAHGSLVRLRLYPDLEPVRTLG